MIKKILFTLFCFTIILNVHAINIDCNGDFSATLELENKIINEGTSTKIKVNKDSVTDGLDYIATYKANNDNVEVKSKDNIATITGKNMGNASINVEIKFLTNNNQIGVCNKKIDIKVIASNVTLKSLTTDKYDLSGIFKSDVYEYSIELPYEVDKLNIIGEPTDTNADVTGLGERYLNEGNQSFMILIKNNGKSNSYKLNVKRLEASNDTSLKSISVDGYILSPIFNSGISEYNLSVLENVDNINIKAEANNINSEVVGIGTHKLVSGNNKFTIRVISQSGETKDYVINVDKKNGTSLLKSLSISKYKIVPKFNRFTFIYDIYVYDDIEKLNIIAEASDGDKIEIVGNEKLKKGINEIYVKVFGQDKTTSVYKINAHMLDKLDYFNNIGNNYGSLTTSLFILFVISIIVMFGFIIYFIKSNKPTKKKVRKKKNKRKVK